VRLRWGDLPPDRLARSGIEGEPWFSAGVIPPSPRDRHRDGSDPRWPNCQLVGMLPRRPARTLNGAQGKDPEPWADRLRQQASASWMPAAGGWITRTLERKTRSGARASTLLPMRCQRQHAT